MGHAELFLIRANNSRPSGQPWKLARRTRKAPAQAGASSGKTLRLGEWPR